MPQNVPQEAFEEHSFHFPNHLQIPSLSFPSPFFTSFLNAHDSSSPIPPYYTFSRCTNRISLYARSCYRPLLQYWSGSGEYVHPKNPGRWSSKNGLLTSQDLIQMKFLQIVRDFPFPRNSCPAIPELVLPQRRLFEAIISRWWMTTRPLVLRNVTLSP